MKLEEPELLKKNEDSNKEFYSNCTTYFAFLQEHGRVDNSFEDEFYFTMPAISGTE